MGCFGLLQFGLYLSISSHALSLSLSLFISLKVATASEAGAGQVGCGGGSGDGWERRGGNSQAAARVDEEHGAHQPEVMVGRGGLVLF